MMQFVTENSMPKQIVSDRGSEFINELFQTVCRNLKAQSKLMTSYHPTCNGMAVKAKSTINKAISHLPSEDKNSWTKHSSRNPCNEHCVINQGYKISHFFIFHSRDACISHGKSLAEQPMQNSLHSRWRLRGRKVLALNQSICRDQTADEDITR